jgi:hypothetical protein
VTALEEQPDLVRSIVNRLIALLVRPTQIEQPHQRVDVDAESSAIHLGVAASNV